MAEETSDERAEPTAEAPENEGPRNHAEPPSDGEGVVPGGALELWRRRHRQAGLYGLGLFLVVHLALNASALRGAAAYDRVVGGLARWGGTPILEVLFVLVPLGVHLFFGWKITRQHGPDATRYGSSRAAKAQRVGAAVLFVLLLAHVWELRGQRLFFGLDADALSTVLTAHLAWTWGGVPWIALLYVIGLASALFHFGNGWTAGATDESERRKARSQAMVVGAVLFLLGFGTVMSFATGTALLPSDPGMAAPCGSAASRPSPASSPSH